MMDMHIATCWTRALTAFAGRKMFGKLGKIARRINWALVATFLAFAGQSANGAEYNLPVKINDAGNAVTISNEHIIFDVDADAWRIAIRNARTEELLLDNAWVAANGWEGRAVSDRDWKSSVVQVVNVEDMFGKGVRVEVSMDFPQRKAVPTFLFSYTLYQGKAPIVIGFGLHNNRDYNVRLMTSAPLIGGEFLPGRKLENPMTLNGGAGAQRTFVQPGNSRVSANTLLFTASADEERRSVVWGGLANSEFGKYSGIHNGRLELRADDPVGRLVEKGETYWSQDTFYLDIVTEDPFLALEEYGREMRRANNANPNVYDFPLLCGWSVHMVSKLPPVNDSATLVKELDAAQKVGLSKYIKIGVRLEPDKYGGDTQQGWWDDERFRKYETAGHKYKHLTAPYDTMARWTAAVRERDGIPYLYAQVGMPSDDYARAFPEHMLFNDISRLSVQHPHSRPLVRFDYTDPSFQEHMRGVWKRLKEDGVVGIKFDYPETAWWPQGGFENRHATTAFAYREAFRLAREGLGPEAFLDERNIGESGRPMLDITAGLVDTQRTWGDSNDYVPQMVSISGLRWYKNRTVFNYFPDTKTVHDMDQKMLQSMLTMMYITSGRLDISTSYSHFTPEIVADVSRIYPIYREPFSARPLDAFTGVKDPQVYDLELTPDWHQVALFNTSDKLGTVSVPLSGDRVSTGAIGLDPSAEYYVYDFWADALVGRLAGDATVSKELQPMHCVMLSIRKKQDNPQLLSTSRHILQGWVDLEDVTWEGQSKALGGKAKAVGEEPFRIVIANNGRKPLKATSDGAEAKLEAHPAGPDYSTLVLNRKDNGTAAWRIDYQ